MIKPSLEEFCQKASSGNLIPVYKEILADLETPVSAYLKTGQGAYSFLLESVEGGAKWARYCFLGCDPAAVITIKGKEITVKDDAGERSQMTGHADPLLALRDILAKYRPVADKNLPRFTGGAVGFVSYDMVRFFERLPERRGDSGGFPDAIFVIADTLLVFDNVAQTIKIVTNVFLDGGDPARLYRKAAEKIAAIEEKLRRAVPNDLLPSANGGKPVALRVDSNFPKEGFKEAVLKAKEYILEGDIFQTVLAQRLQFRVTQDAFTIYRALRTINPSPYMYYLKFGDWRIVGSSPEVLVRKEGDCVEARPIAGTRPRGKTAEEDKSLERELLRDAKELAEHIMLVDLGRNDLGRIAATGTVEVNEKFVIERYSHVMHIVSNVRCRLRKGYDSFDVLRAAFPAGTVSGAPKIRAMEIIDELEPSRRGLYAGAVGYFSFDGNMDTAIAIRTLLIKDGTAWLGVGAGIVADSDPEREFEETMNKGKALLRAVELAERGLDL